MERISYLRQLDLLDPGKFTGKIRIIGCGGIGSPVAIILAKMGFSRFILMDGDTVESHNLPNQLFAANAIGKPKVEALAGQMRSFNPEVEIETVQEMFTDNFRWPQPASREIVIVAVDSLKSRACIWGRCKGKLHIVLYIDARMAAEQFELQVVRPGNPDDVKDYEATLFQVVEGRRSLRKPVEIPCTRRAIAFNTFIIGGFIAAEVKKFVMGEENLFPVVLGDLVTRSVMAV